MSNSRLQNISYSVCVINNTQLLSLQLLLAIIYDLKYSEIRHMIYKIYMLNSRVVTLNLLK